MGITVAEAAKAHRAKQREKLARLLAFAALAKAELRGSTTDKGKRLHAAACEALGEAK